LNSWHEVEDADDGNEIEVDPGPISPEPNVLVEDRGHVLQGRVLLQTIQTFLDPES